MSTQERPASRGRFEELATSECMELLSAKSVGRVALCTPSGRQVFPVNYVIDSGGVVFRTAPYTQLARLLRDARAAFQIDEIDEFLQSGWSVLVVGRAQHVDDIDSLPNMRVERPDPWASGDRTLYIRIHADEVTGRRVHPG